MMTKHRPRVKSAWILHQATNKYQLINALRVIPENKEPPAYLNAIAQEAVRPDALEAVPRDRFFVRAVPVTGAATA